MATIPYDIYVQAGMNWDKAHDPNPPNFPTWGHGLTEFLRWDIGFMSRWDSYDRKLVTVPEHVVHKLTLLASPHYEALIKAYKIRQQKESVADHETVAYKK